MELTNRFENNIEKLFSLLTDDQKKLHNAGFRCAKTNLNDWSYPANPNEFWFDMNDESNFYSIFFQLNDGNYRVSVDFYTKYGTVTEDIHVRRMPIGKAIYAALKTVEDKLKLMLK